MDRPTTCWNVDVLCCPMGVDLYLSSLDEAMSGCIDRLWLSATTIVDALARSELARMGPFIASFAPLTGAPCYHCPP
jgi:hypothetical protein